ncbi:MAG: hypothetical protein HY819_09600 [Acidobacteria bacterium]|nr:hypothetical protein [Acidobacteriota bacterium]
MSSFFDKAKKLSQTIGVSKDKSQENLESNLESNLENNTQETQLKVETSQTFINTGLEKVQDLTNTGLGKVQGVAGSSLEKAQAVAELSKVKIKGVANLGREAVEDVSEFAWDKVQSVAGKGLDSINQAIDSTMADLQGLKPILSKCGFSIDEIEIEFSFPPEFQVSITQPKNATAKLEEAIKDVTLTKTQQIFVSSLRAVNLANDFISEKYSEYIEDITVVAGFPPKLKVKLK